MKQLGIGLTGKTSIVQLGGKGVKDRFRTAITPSNLLVESGDWRRAIPHFTINDDKFAICGNHEAS